MVGDLPIDGECSVCGGRLESVEEEIEKKRRSLDDPQMYREIWKILKCVECGHIEGKELLSSEQILT